MIGIRIYTEQLARNMTTFKQDQLPWATVLTLNGLAKASHEAVQQRLLSRGFRYQNARTQNWVLRHVRFDRGMRAEKRKLRAEIGVFAGVGSQQGGRWSLLADFEAGGERTPGKRPGLGRYGPVVFVPLLRPLARELYPTTLGIQPRRTIEGGWTGASLSGSRKSFVMQTVKGPMLMQRQTKGRGPESRRKLGIFKPRVPIPQRPYFYATVRRTVDAQTVTIARQSFAQAMATRRPR